jgi:prophage antirepressor-like protein|nr:MAG TPA: antirepressor [Caudoviricetes sp.]
MKDLMIFKNEEFGEIRSLEINNEPYFIGKEIATVLGYKNGSRDINRHVDEEDRKVLPFR